MISDAETNERVVSCESINMTVDLPDEIVWSILLALDDQLRRDDRLLTNQTSRRERRSSINDVCSLLSKFYAELWNDERRSRFYDQIINDPAEFTFDPNTMHLFVKYSNVDELSRYVDDNIEALMANSFVDEDMFIDTQSTVTGGLDSQGKKRLYRYLLSSGQMIADRFGTVDEIHEALLKDDDSLRAYIRRDTIITSQKSLEYKRVYTFILCRTSSSLISNMVAPKKYISIDNDLRYMKTLAVCSIDDILSKQQSSELGIESDERVCERYFGVVNRWLQRIEFDSFSPHYTSTTTRRVGPFEATTADRTGHSTSSVSNRVGPFEAIEHIGSKLTSLIHRVFGYGYKYRHRYRYLVLDEDGTLSFKGKVIKRHPSIV